MNYNEVLTITSQILITAGLISLVVSLLMEFLVKKIFKLKTQVINGIIVGLSEALTVLCGVIYIQVKAIHPAWFVYVGIVFLGFLVSIIAMNGYDKIFSYVYEWIRGLYGKDK